MGLGYIIGLRYSAIICAGSFVSWFLLVPLVAHFGAQLSTAIPPAAGGTLIGSMSAEVVFRTYVRQIGIGGIAAAGIMGILRSWRIIAKAFGLGFKELLGGKRAAAPATERTDRDVSMGLVLVGILAVALGTWLFFRFGVLASSDRPTPQSLIALAVVIVISFLFTTVAARAIAVVGTNPVSGMTLMTLILTSIFLVGAGLTGKAGMLAALLIGGVVCTALSMAGGFVTDLKIGYWIGATPAVQERSKFLGTIVASLTVGAVILLLNQAYGFAPSAAHPESEVLVAPQANAMAAVIKTLMSNEPVPWLLYGVGALIAMTMQMIGVPSLAFALGMYIPQELNTPLLVGGLVAYFVSKSAGKDEKLEAARTQRGHPHRVGLHRGRRHHGGHRGAPEVPQDEGEPRPALLQLRERERRAPGGVPLPRPDRLHVLGFEAGEGGVTHGIPGCRRSFWQPLSSGTRLQAAPPRFGSNLTRFPGVN